MRWFRLAADQGHADAQFELGVMYYAGVGVPQDEAEAVRWYRFAADQGNASAQHTLGFAYLHGRGVPQNDTEAIRWYRLAANQGDATAQFRVGAMYDTGEGRRGLGKLFGRGVGGLSCRAVRDAPRCNAGQ